MNNDLRPINTIPNFKRFCMTIGELPTSYLETMTYYEMLLWFTEYMKNTIIPTINNNGLAIQELQDKYIELKSYVDNYFTNLDVQEEINNKLDSMVTDGTLPEIVGIKFSETANLNSIELTIIGVTGYYSTMRVDNVDGAGQPINKEHMIWNVVGVKEFDDARKFICVTSQCEEAIFNIEQIRELYDQKKINGVFFDKNGLLKVYGKCNKQVYDY